jgi:ADP-ribosylglycohydrolase
MESELQTRTWWEAWVPVAVVWACAGIVEYEPLAALQLMMEFGHDTDSYAQVMGAFMGALHGKDVFPAAMRETVNRRMREQFGQNVHDWMRWIENSRARQR